MMDGVVVERETNDRTFFYILTTGKY